MPTTLARRKTRNVRPMAQTIRDVVELRDPMVRTIMDLGVSITPELVDDVIWCGVFGWAHRTPPSAVKDGDVVKTEFDYLSMLVALAERRAMIEIPSYRARRPTVQAKGERRIVERRFGHIVALVSNANAFSFSVRIHDQGLAIADGRGRERVGDERTYMLVDLNGKLRAGAGRVVFKPDSDETAFFRRIGVLPRDVDAVQFNTAVHRNRQQSLGAAPYLRMKLLHARVVDELEHCDRMMAWFRAQHVAAPSGHDYSSPRSRRVGATKRINVRTMEAQIEHPRFEGSCPYPVATTECFGQWLEHRKLLNGFRERVQFVTRADELAYWLYGYREQYVNQWLGQSSWDVPAGRSTAWRRLYIANGFALRLRVKTVAQKVSAKRASAKVNA